MSLSRKIQATVGKSIVNPIVRWSLGSGPTLPFLRSSVAVIEHRGRRSGVDHKTPVGYVDGGPRSVLVVAERGRRSDWVRNGIAAGQVWVESEGRRWRARIAPRLDLDPNETLRSMRSSLVALSNRALQDRPEVIELIEH